MIEFLFQNQPTPSMKLCLLIKYYHSNIKEEKHLYKTKEDAPCSPQGFPSYLTFSQKEREINNRLEKSVS